METAIVPGIYDPALADEDIGVSTEEAHELTRRLAQDGLFVGISSGANLAGALRVARNTSDAVIVVVFCDGGEKYLSERFWDEDATPRLTLERGVEQAIRAHGAETYPNECCGALYGRDGVVTDDVGAVEYDRRGTAASFPGSSTGLRGRPNAAPRSSAPSCSGSTIRIRIILRGHRSTISITRGRFSRTSSCPFAGARQRR